MELGRGGDNDCEGEEDGQNDVTRAILQSDALGENGLAGTVFLDGIMAGDGDSDGLRSSEVGEGPLYELVHEGGTWNQGRRDLGTKHQAPV